MSSERKSHNFFSSGRPLDKVRNEYLEVITLSEASVFKKLEEFGDFIPQMQIDAKMSLEKFFQAFREEISESINTYIMREQDLQAYLKEKAKNILTNSYQTNRALLFCELVNIEPSHIFSSNNKASRFGPQLTQFKKMLVSCYEDVGKSLKLETNFKKINIRVPAGYAAPPSTPKDTRPSTPESKSKGNK